MTKRNQTSDPLKTSDARLLEDLRRERDLLRRYLDTVETVIVALDNQGLITSLNQKGCRLLGYSEEELIGRSWFETCLAQPEGREKVYPVFLDLMAGRIENAEYFENSIITKTGEIRLIEWHNTLLCDDNGRITGALSSGNDVTDRKRAEQALKAGEAKYRNLFDNAVVGMYRSKIDGSAILEANRAICAIFERTREEMISEPATMRWANPAARENLIRLLEKNGVVADFEADFIAKNGSIKNCLVSAKLYPEEGYLEGTTIDITARRIAEENYRRLFNEMLDGFALHEIILNEQGRPVDYRYIAANPAFERMTGLKAADIIGRAVTEALPGVERHWIDTYGKVALTREPAFFENYAEALQKHFEVTAFSPAPGQFACIFADITERKQAEENRIKLEEQLRQSQKLEAIGRLAGGVAHDFNNMLAVMIGHTELALDHIDPQTPPYADLLAIRKASEHSANLVRHLLAFARKQTIAPKIINLNETVQNMVNMLKRLIGEDIDLTLKLQEHLWQVRIDPGQVDQVLANLCINAGDAIAGRGWITIETRNITCDEIYRACHKGVPSGDYVLLSVSDSGCGMDAATLEKIFEPFFTTKEIGKGSGLGLSTVYGIVTQNSGTIDVKSTPGRGTVFDIYLPRHPGNSEKNQTAAAAAHIETGHETILLVEDEPSLLKMTEVMLTRMGYSVLAALKAEQALRLAAEHGGKIQLLITDVVMPDMNGRDLAEKLRSIRPGLRCLFMSGYTADVIARQGVLDEGVHFIQKPFTKKEFAEKVRRALDAP